MDVAQGGRISWDFEFWNGFVYLRERPWFHSFEMDGFMGGLSFIDEHDGERFYRKVLEQGVRSGMTSDELRIDVLGLTGLDPSRDTFRTSITRQHKGFQKLSQISKPRHFRHLTSNDEEHAMRYKSTKGNMERSNKLFKLTSDEDIYWAKALGEMRILRTHSRDEPFGQSGFDSQRESKSRPSTSDSRSPPPLPPRRKGNLTPHNPPTPDKIVLSPSQKVLHSNPSAVSQRISNVQNAEPQPDNRKDRNFELQGSLSIPKSPSPPPLCSPPSISQLILSPTNNPASIPVHDHDAQGRSALLASIRLSGGVGALRKVVPF